MENVVALITNGANVNALDKEHETPLHLAIKSGIMQSLYNALFNTSLPIEYARWLPPILFGNRFCMRFRHSIE